jgi:hypothetical protein
MDGMDETSNTHVGDWKLLNFLIENPMKDKYEA